MSGQGRGGTRGENYEGTVSGGVRNVYGRFSNTLVCVRDYIILGRKQRQGRTEKSK